MEYHAALCDNGNEETDLENVNQTVAAAVPANTTSDVTTTIHSENATVVYGDKHVVEGDIYQAEHMVINVNGQGKYNTKV